MQWAECAKTSETAFGQSRFAWPESGWSGFNCEPGLSISDITGGIAWLWTYPADYLLRLPAVASFLELEPNHVGGGLSGAITFGFAALVGIFIKAVLDDMAFHRQA